MLDFYELLGIDMSASKADIKKAYHAMVKKYHPDVNHSDEANDIIRSLNEAKEVLLDDDKRREYDTILDDMAHSKQFSRNSEETYAKKSEVYKETYSEVYVTKFEYYINYLKNSVDSLFLKIIKSFLVIFNYLVFFLFKCLSFVFIWLVYMFSELIDYLIGFIFLLAVLAIFFIDGSGTPDYIPFIPANIEEFCFLSFCAMVIAIFKEIILVRSFNVFVFLGNMEEKIFVKILMK